MCVASSAAPTFFPIFKYNGKYWSDGGLVANNPSLYAFTEACKNLNVENPGRDVMIVCFGTGEYVREETPESIPETTLDNALFWGKNLVKIMTNVSSKMVSNYMSGIFD